MTFNRERIIEELSQIPGLLSQEDHPIGEGIRKLFVQFAENDYIALTRLYDELFPSEGILNYERLVAIARAGEKHYYPDSTFGWSPEPGEFQAYANQRERAREELRKIDFIRDDDPKELHGPLARLAHALSSLEGTAVGLDAPENLRRKIKGNIQRYE